jgi:hypothetical protein
MLEEREQGGVHFVLKSWLLVAVSTERHLSGKVLGDCQLTTAQSKPRCPLQASHTVWLTRGWSSFESVTKWVDARDGAIFATPSLSSSRRVATATRHSCGWTAGLPASHGIEDGTSIWVADKIQQ